MSVSNAQNKIGKSGKDGYFQKLWKTFCRQKFLHMLILPGVIYFIIFKYMPMYGVQIAFKDYNIRLGITGSEWVGWYHFNRFFTHPHCWRVIRNTFTLNVYLLLFSFPSSVLLALILNEVKRPIFKKVVQTISYLPNFISVAAVCGMMTMMLSPTSGMVNQILKSFGMEPIYFLVEPKWYRTIFVLSDIWKNCGFGAIIYLASLSSVPMELYEAADMDGATRIQKIRHVSIPFIAPTIIIMLIFQVGRIMNLGQEKSLLLQTPSTYEVSDIISTYVYRRGLAEADYSFGAAVGLFNSLVNVVFVLTVNYLAGKFSETSLF